MSGGMTRDPQPWGQGGRPARDSVGYRKTYAPGDGRFQDLKLESDSPKQIRIAYEGEQWADGRVFLVRATLRSLLDSSQVEQSLIVPWQGVALTVAAGTSQLILDTATGFQSLPLTPATENTVNLQLSVATNGYSERRPARERPAVAQSDGWYNATVVPERVFPPLFATSMVVYNYGLATLAISNLSMGTAWTVAPGGSADVPIPDPGFFDIAVIGGNALCAIRYRVTV